MNLLEMSKTTGGMDQSARETSLRKLKDGECKCLFATDVCSRGLDIKGITHVINYGMPNQVEDYVFCLLS